MGEAGRKASGRLVANHGIESFFSYGPARSGFETVEEYSRCSLSRTVPVNAVDGLLREILDLQTASSAHTISDVETFVRRRCARSAPEERCG